jgi:hypothetical protein
MTTLSNFQGSRSIAVIADDSRPTPNPASLVHGGTTTAAAPSKLTDGGARFTEYNIAVGDIVYNDTTGQITDVTAVDSDTTLAVTDNIFLLGNDYRVFRISQLRPFLFTLNGPDTPAPTPGLAQDILIVNAGGDTVAYAMKVGDSAPVQAVRIPRTGNPAGISGTATFA